VMRDDVKTFTVFFIGWLLFFSFLYQTIGIEVEGLDNLNFNRQFSYFLRIFRNSVGDLDAPSMPYWETHADNEDTITGSQVMIHYGWFIWLLNVFVMVIVLLNFLIAIIGQSYDTVMGTSVEFKAKQRCDMAIETRIFKNGWR